MNTSGGTAQPSPTPRLAFQWNLPNVLTIIRMVVVPVFLVVLLTHPHNEGWRVGAAVLFIVGILTDFLDGYLARRNNQVTDFGKIWDSIADKALTGAAFIGLSVLGELPWWMTIVILVREWGITALRFAILRYAVMAANRGGKVKTFVQSLALILFLLWLPGVGAWFEIAKWVLMWAALVLTVVTGVDYLRAARRIRQAGLAAHQPGVDRPDGPASPGGGR